ncbi:2-methylisocitrate lyase-like PEP mutase family enzyme [Bosea sp. BE125]|uniref:isocitrate lyase/PEP mutase family protein n=1 Tax=Bosea sp. BE125 TaxID=2817909 RepID=UPI00285F63C2|nr:isocitrate lyase/PEP mutase family protein [Bosea sp. BE125]MDR6869515.1 2-methylisocitrate lyase-like PEP mutase family enzyme [Bosea sp. BE125]
MTLSLKARFAQAEIVLAPGVYDALTASLAEAAGFEALYVSGASIAYTRLGRPDIGLVSMAEVADTITMIRDRIATPLIVDADTGYGNALNMQRTMRLFERAGANALQIEDQSFPKRCGHLADKGVIPAAEMVGKIKAAVDARASQETLIIARTDAIAVEGFEAALERAHLYAQAGADMLFVEAPGSADELGRVTAELKGLAPLMANMVEGGRTPIKSAGELEALGFSLVIFPGGIVRALARAAQDFYGTLKRDGSTGAFRNQMFDFDQLNAVIGTPQMIAAGRSYEADQIIAAAEKSKQA